MNTEKISVMVNGMPGPMAVAVAEVCLDRGYNLIPIGFTGNDQPTFITVNSEKNGYVDVELMAGPGLNGAAGKMLESLKTRHENLIIVDYTHPSAILDNIQCYCDNNVDFVMGTTGGDTGKMMEVFDKGKNTAIIAPNMAKQIVALQASLQAMATRFPKAFADYTLTVTESHQSTKADTSGTAKAIVSHLLTLSPSEFKESDIVKLRDANNQIAFKVPEESLKGHAFHTYRLTSADNSVSFELQHNVCGRRVYAEGSVDAVEFLHKLELKKNSAVIKSTEEKRIFNMIDVLENGEMI
eukprot:CAMPEP_0119040862 /NCGR_PEP_ID=MMETSP1177-20130426/10908_1 /TAXON_ID=2985 /ORGANISM="Ochromonas sp, Strain CCMP1899" /LENGTH=296 /DNA_ID=CAMNT_0007006333 /DNA_START=231 /DNA_END=1121 /DNA_ORIENTATION=-